MIQTIVAGSALAAAPEFIESLEDNGAEVLCLDTARETIEALSEKKFDLLVASENLEDMSGLGLIETVVKTQPMLNCAVASPLSAEDYHEASEGLGILMQLPPEPGRVKAVGLLDQLKRIQSFKVGR